MLTAPVVTGNYVVVGDAQGVLHWLSKNDGSFAGRIEVNQAGFFANPVSQNDIVYTMTKNGYLSAYALS
jgi:outer membrane protein assembly factor BamB